MQILILPFSYQNISKTTHATKTKHSQTRMYPVHASIHTQTPMGVCMIIWLLRGYEQQQFCSSYLPMTARTELFSTKQRCPRLNNFC